jgi:hypothetical protein
MDFGVSISSWFSKIPGTEVTKLELRCVSRSEIICVKIPINTEYITFNQFNLKYLFQLNW